MSDPHNAEAVVFLIDTPAAVPRSVWVNVMLLLLGDVLQAIDSVSRNHSRPPSGRGAGKMVSRMTKRVNLSDELLASLKEGAEMPDGRRHAAQRLENFRFT